MTTFNKAQQIVLQTYGGGDYAHIDNIKGCRNVGDGLFTFLMTELSDDESCDTLEIAINRVTTASNQLLDLRDMLVVLKEHEALADCTKDYSPLEREVFDWTARVLKDPEAARTPEFTEFAIRMRSMIMDPECVQFGAVIQSAREFVQGGQS